MASTLSLTILIPITIYFCFLQYRISVFTEDKKDKFYVRVWLAFFIICNFIFYINIDLRSPVDIILIVGYGCMIIFFWGFHIIYKYVLRQDGKYMKPVDVEFQEKREFLHEFLRKFFHFFVFGGCLLFVVLYSTISMDVIKKYPDFGAYGKNLFWENSIFAPLNYDFPMDAIFFRPTQMQIGMIIFFMIALPFGILAEYFRLNPKLGIPFQPLFVKSLRPHEQNNAADYYYFIFGFFIATYFLPAAAAFGVLCIMCFGDTFASLVGKMLKKEKKHYIKWEPKKCWEGSIAGFLATFISAIFFVGWILALVLSTIFIIFDATTPTKIKISDNFIYPLVGVFTLFIILSLGFQMDAIVANYFTDINNWFAERAREVIY
ncbi:MAG: diacylglycerol/polyprenol kinase family protein [Promethearchaeia archaeon]